MTTTTRMKTSRGRNRNCYKTMSHSSTIRKPRWTAIERKLFARRTPPPRDGTRGSVTNSRDCVRENDDARQSPRTNTPRAPSPRRRTSSSRTRVERSFETASPDYARSQTRRARCVVRKSSYQNGSAGRGRRSPPRGYTASTPWKPSSSLHRTACTVEVEVENRWKKYYSRLNETPAQCIERTCTL